MDLDEKYDFSGSEEIGVSTVIRSGTRGFHGTHIVRDALDRRYLSDSVYAKCG